MAEKQIRYSEYLEAIRRHSRQVSYSEVVSIDLNRPPRRSRLRAIDLHRLLTPYVSVRLGDQLRAVIPLALMLVGFQALALRTTPDEAATIALGICTVMLGLMFFLEGVKLGLMPFAENIGFLMPGRANVLTLLGFGLLLGTAATFAEPAIATLQAAADSVSAERAALLKSLLGPRADWLVLAVAVGVGLAVVLGLLRFMLGWRLKTLVLLIVPVCLGVTAYAAGDAELVRVLALAWDCGGITTGPVTVPLVLALGIGVAASSGRGDNPLAGFGIVTLASLLPVVTVLAVAIHFNAAGALPPAAAAAAETPWYRLTPFAETLAALRAILPLVLLLFLAQTALLRTRLKRPGVLAYGIAAALIGMAAFNLGLSAGLVELGNQAGNNVPWAFAPHRQTGEPPLYPRLLGLTMTLVFAFCIGYGATVAEPALNAMGLTVQNLTDGAFTKRLLIHAVAAGVGIGAALGVARILFDLPLAHLLIGAYALALALTAFSREEFVNLAWDSAGVTTGPVTVPLLLALGIGLGEAVGAPEGFGILAMCSVGPILSVLALGLWVDYHARLRARGLET
jgi:hypothetical protein